jgi:hypothetical protein
MTVSTYPINTGIEAYNKQSRVRLRTPVVSESGTKEKFVDVVTLSGKSDIHDETPVKNAYTWEDLLPKKS